MRPIWSVSDCVCCSECYPRGSIHCNAEGATKSCDCIWGRAPDPLWWCLSSASVPLADRVQERGGHGGSLGAAQPSLQRRRDAARAALSNDPRTGTDRDDPVAATERRVPVPHGTPRLSESVHAAAILAARGANGAPPVAEVARSLAGAHDSAATPVVETDLRCRLDRPRPLRQARGGKDRLQPDQAGPALVSSLAVFRGADQGLLARGVTPRRRPYRQWDTRPAHSVFRKEASEGPADDSPCRQRV